MLYLYVSAQAPLSAVKRSSSNTPLPMFSYILRKGEAKNKRFPISLEMEKNADDWEREPNMQALIRSLWHI